MNRLIPLRGLLYAAVADAAPLADEGIESVVWHALALQSGHDPVAVPTHTSAAKAVDMLRADVVSTLLDGQVPWGMDVRPLDGDRLIAESVSAVTVRDHAVRDEGPDMVRKARSASASGVLVTGSGVHIVPQLAV